MDITTLYDLPASLVTRESFFNMGGPNGLIRWIIYAPAFLVLAWIIITLRKKIKIWKKGKSELRTDHPLKRLWMLVKYAVFQLKVLKEAYAGIMHASIFFAFAGLFIVTLMLLIQDDFTELVFHTKFLVGWPYLIWSLFADLCGLALIFGLIIAIYRRYVSRPTRLDTKRTDTTALLLILGIVVTGFTTEGLRIVMLKFPGFEIWSPVGFATGKIFAIMGDAAMSVAHRVSWVIHVVFSLLFLALLATNKVGHILITMLNIFFGDLKNEDPKTKYTMSVIPPQEFETSESFGVTYAEEFTWKQLMDGDACTRCGRCQDNCPAHLTEKPLSPKKIINDIKDNKDERIRKLLAAARGKKPEEVDVSAVECRALVGGSVQTDEIWACTNCAACMEACPVLIEHIDAINSMRRSQVLMEGKMAAELQTTFTNMENNFNPYGFAFASRGDWAAETGIKTVAEDPDIDYLYFVGCSASFDKRNQKTAAALVKILMKAGYKVGILGQEEACCGDSALRAGNEYLFQTLAMQNLETFKNYGIRKIITTCPHGYNVLKKEYPVLAGKSVDSEGRQMECSYEIFHHTEVISDLIRKGMIKIRESIDEKITYHDSCMLGRYNSIYKQPREIIRNIPGTDLVEMSRHHKRSFCCGAGGGRMWLEEKEGTRINQFRTKDAQNTGATKVCTACPFCMTMISDGVNDLDISNLETLDIAELVYRTMEK